MHNFCMKLDPLNSSEIETGYFELG